MDWCPVCRRLASLAALAVALLGSAAPQAADARARGFSLTPSMAEPYAACGRPSAGHAACLAILVPAATTQSSSGALRPALAPTLSGSGVGGGYSPADLRSAYNLPSASAGTGQTVAIIDAYDDPNAESDLATYRSRYGLSACTSANGCFRKVNQSGGTALPKAEAGWAVEISLDLDMASAACPNCHILLVEATSNSYGNLFAAEDEAVALGATEISNSWAGEEFSEETSADSYFNHPGVAITASAGDGGYKVEYPAASPYVIAVGGTKLSKASNSRGWSETAWSGTGSGCSAYEPKPTWQTDSGCKRRTDDDVAAVASPETPVSVADSYKLPAEFSKPEAGWTLVGGTSASSPLVAGMMALANAHTRSFAGADALYIEAAQNGTGALDDVVSGSNGSCGGSYLCTAGLGYDGPTGLGSPYGAPLVKVEPAKVPHWFQNLSRIEEGRKVPYISWGTITLTTSGGGAATECQSTAAGYVKNPTGANAGAFEGVGTEATEAFSLYQCTNPECAAAGGKVGVTAEGLPWPGALSEEAKWTFRLASAAVHLYVHCQFAYAPPSEKPGTGSHAGLEERTSAEYNAPNAALCSAGSLKPQELGGSSIGKPSTLVFSTGAGGELECGAAGKGATTGSLKLMGYEESELITVKSP